MGGIFSWLIANTGVFAFCNLSSGVMFSSLHPEGILIMRDGSVGIWGAWLEFGSLPEHVRGSTVALEKVSFFLPDRILTDLPTYRQVVLENLYPNIDGIIMVIDRGIEIQFVVHPGAEVSDIRIGIREGYVDTSGGEIALILDDGRRMLLNHARAYQGIREVSITPVVDSGFVTFEVGPYDRSLPLVIDPTITVLPASPGRDEGYAVVSTEIGVYVAGTTLFSSQFAPERDYFGSTNVRDTGDVFVTLMSSDLSTHIATAIIGSAGGDYATSMDVGPDGTIYVAGWTSDASTFAPSRGFFGDTGIVDVFITHLSAYLDAHLGSAILSSRGMDYAYALRVSPDGGVYVAGYTQDYSTFAPSRNIFGQTGSYDAFVSLFSGDLDVHIATAILGSPGMDGAMALALDEGGKVLISGFTWLSSDFAPWRYVLGNPGSMDAFVSSMDSSLSTHLSTTILASGGMESANALYQNSHKVYIGGWTDSPEDFSLERIIRGSTGGTEAFITLLDDSLVLHIWSVVLASPGDDEITAISGGGGGEVYVAGLWGHPAIFPAPVEIRGSPGGGDAFLIRMEDSLPLWMLILASDTLDVARDVYADSSKLYVVGITEGGVNFTGGALPVGNMGGRDAFLTRVEGVVGRGESLQEDGRKIYIAGERIILHLHEPSYVGLEVYDEAGRRVLVMSRGMLLPGTHSIPLELDPGKYLLRVRIGGELREATIVIN